MKKMKRNLIMLAGLLFCLAGSVKTHAASLPKQQEIWFVTYSGGSIIRGSHLICLTGCTPETTIKKVTCSSSKIKAEMYTYWDGEDIEEAENRFDQGENCTIELDIKHTKKGYAKLKDKTRVKLTVLVSEGGREQTLTTTVVFKEATLSRMFKSIKFNGKAYKPKQTKVHTNYKVKFKPQKSFKTVMVPKKGVRFDSTIAYHYYKGNINSYTTTKAVKLGKKVPLRQAGGTPMLMQFSFVPPLKKPAGITKAQAKLLDLEWEQSADVLAPWDIYIEFAS